MFVRGSQRMPEPAGAKVSWNACCAALLGATLGELGTVTMVFFLVSAVVYIRRRSGK